MNKFSGIKLDFSKSGTEEVGVVIGEEIKPHRLDLIKKKMANEDYDGLEDMFFNFHVKGCKNPSTWDQCMEESSLFDEYKNIIRAADNYFRQGEIASDVA